MISSSRLANSQEFSGKSPSAPLRKAILFVLVILAVLKRENRPSLKIWLRGETSVEMVRIISKLGISLFRGGLAETAVATMRPLYLCVESQRPFFRWWATCGLDVSKAPNEKHSTLY